MGTNYREPARPLRAITVSDVHVLAQNMLQQQQAGERKRLIIFADNRQDAAFQAGWMQDHARRYRLPGPGPTGCAGPLINDVFAGAHPLHDAQAAPVYFLGDFDPTKVLAKPRHGRPRRGGVLRLALRLGQLEVPIVLAHRIEEAV